MLGVTTDQKTAAEALQENTYDQFLYDVMLKDCKIKVPLAEYKLGIWPKSEEKYSYQEFISKTKELLKKINRQRVRFVFLKNVMIRHVMATLLLFRDTAKFATLLEKNARTISRSTIPGGKTGRTSTAMAGSMLKITTNTY